MGDFKDYQIGDDSIFPKRKIRDHELKNWPVPFEQVWRGTKQFEVRKNDRGFKVGDSLLLREWIEKTDGIKGHYTGREILTEVTYLTQGPNWGLPEHLVVMSIRTIRKSGL